MIISKAASLLNIGGIPQVSMKSWAKSGEWFFYPCLSFCILLFSCSEPQDYLAAFHAQDYDTSFRLLKQAEQTRAEPEVYNLLGIHYELALATSHDYTKAYDYYEKAALQGSPQAQLNLGRLIESGRYKINDFKTAYQWYWLALKNGNEKAEPYVFNLETQMFKLDILDAREKAEEFLNKK